MNFDNLLPVSENGRKLSALALGLALAFGVLMAGIARVAETPAAGATGRFGSFAPGDLGMIRFELAKLGVSRITVDEEIARSALTGMPLASDPFTALAAPGLMADPKGRSGRESALLAEALRRDPRSRAARILTLRQMAANGDLKGAIDQLAVFSRLNSGLVEAIIEAITARITSPGQVDDALAAIAGHDSLYLPFVNRMTGKSKPREVVLRLAQGLPANVMAQPAIRRAMVYQLVGAGEYLLARNLWQQGNRGGASGLVHSPDFADRQAPPPFNWELFVSSTGAAERAKTGGLSISYYDRDPGPLASQLLTLQPGSYQVSAEYEVLGGTADNVRIKVTCRGSETLLAEGALVARKPGVNLLRLNIAVPGLGCPAQTLAIMGVASEERGETQFLVRRIDVNAGRSGQ